MTKKRAVFFYWMPVALYCLAIFIQSSYPSDHRLPSFSGSDKLLHFGGYFVLGALFYRAWATTRIKDRPGLVAAISIVCAVGFGISDEIHQDFVPWRSADWMDAVADMAGSVFGVLGYRAALGKTQKESK